MPGPVPKRSSERRRTNKSSQAESVSMVGPVVAPTADEDWHPIAFRWYTALGESGQSRHYEPSDWAYAYLWADIVSRQLQGGRVSAQMMASWDSAATKLLTTEADRRRSRMEVDRTLLEAAPEPVATLDDYRSL